MTTLMDALINHGKHAYTCKHCGRRFPTWYWGITGRAGGYGTVRKPGLAAANFQRHEQSCRSREMIACPKDTTEEKEK